MTKWLLLPIPILFVVLWCLGGQLKTYWRRFVLPGVVCLLSLAYCHFTTDRHWYQALLALIFIPDFIDGYSEKSWLYKWTKSLPITRLLYGFICAATVAIEAMWNGHPYAIFILFLEPILFICEFGSWGKIGKYDILGDDIVRSLGLGIFWVWAIL